MQAQELKKKEEEEKDSLGTCSERDEVVERVLVEGFSSSLSSKASASAVGYPIRVLSAGHSFSPHQEKNILNSGGKG